MAMEERTSGGSEPRERASGRREPLAVDAIRAKLLSEISRELEMEAEDIDTCESLINYGLDSAQGVLISGDLGEWLGRPLPPTVIWEYPSIEALVSFLAEYSQNHSEATFPE